MAVGKPSSLLSKDFPAQSFGEGRNTHLPACNPHPCSVSKPNKLMGAGVNLGGIISCFVVGMWGRWVRNFNNSVDDVTNL